MLGLKRAHADGRRRGGGVVEGARTEGRRCRRGGREGELVGVTMVLVVGMAAVGGRVVVRVMAVVEVCGRDGYRVVGRRVAGLVR